MIAPIYLLTLDALSFSASTTLLVMSVATFRGIEG